MKNLSQHGQEGITFFFFFLVDKIQEYILEDNFIYKTSFSQYVRLTYMRLTHIYERDV